MVPERIGCQQSWCPTLWTSGVLVSLMTTWFLGGDGLLAADDRAKTPPSLQIEPKPKGIVFAVAFSKDNQQLALACEDKTVTVHDAKSGKLLTRLEGHTERVWTAAFSPDGRTLASCSGEYATPKDAGMVKVWDLKTGKEKASLAGHKGLVFHVTFSPDGKTILSGGWDATVRLWDVTTGKEMKTLNDHTGPVRTIIYAPDGKSFATATFDGTVRFWDAATAKLQKTLNAHNTGVQCLAFSPNGKYLATTARPTGGAADSEIALWDLTSDKEPARFTGNRGHILSLDFSPDGKMLASGGGSFSQFGEVKLFEVASRLERAKLKDHKEWVECVKFSPDGRLLASAGGFTRGVAGQIDIQRLTELLEKKRSTTADLTADQLKVLWDTLGDADAAKAYQAILALSGAGKQVVPYLRNRLKDVPKEKPKTVDAVRIAQWIAELDDDNPDVRDKASEELKRAGTAAQPYLRKALEKVSSAEVRIRLEVLLNKAPGVPSQTLRVIRVLEALEHNATPEARELLAKLAGEELKGDLREQAKASLTRLSTVQK